MASATDLPSRNGSRKDLSCCCCCCFCAILLVLLTSEMSKGHWDPWRWCSEHSCQAMQPTETDVVDLPRREGLSGSSATLLLLLLCSSTPLLLRAALLSRLPAESFLAPKPALDLRGAAWLSSPLSEAVSGRSDEPSSPSAYRWRFISYEAFERGRGSGFYGA